MLLVTTAIPGFSGCSRQTDEKPEALYDPMVDAAVAVLKDYWKNEIYLPDENVEK